MFTHSPPFSVEVVPGSRDRPKSKSFFASSPCSKTCLRPDRSEAQVFRHSSASMFTHSPPFLVEVVPVFRDRPKSKSFLASSPCSKTCLRPDRSEAQVFRHANSSAPSLLRHASSVCCSMGCPSALTANEIDLNNLIECIIASIFFCMLRGMSNHPSSACLIILINYITKIIVVSRCLAQFIARCLAQMLPPMLSTPSHPSPCYHRKKRTQCTALEPPN